MLTQEDYKRLEKKIIQMQGLLEDIRLDLKQSNHKKGHDVEEYYIDDPKERE